MFRCCGGCVRLRQSRVAAHAVSAGPAGSLRHLPVLGVPHPSRLHVQRPGHGMSQGHRLPEVLRHQPAPSHRSAGSDLGVLYPLTFPLPSSSFSLCNEVGGRGRGGQGYTPSSSSSPPLPLPSSLVMKLGGGRAGLYPLPSLSTSFSPPLVMKLGGGCIPPPLPLPHPFHFLLPW